MVVETVHVRRGQHQARALFCKAEAHCAAKPRSAPVIMTTRPSRSMSGRSTSAMSSPYKISLYDYTKAMACLR